MLDSLPRLPGRFSRAMELSRVGMVGYSMGGHSRSSDATWSSFWSHQRGWKRELRMDTGGHGSFSDYEFSLTGLARASGLPPDVLSEGLGTIDPECAVGLVRRALDEFFGRFLER